MALRLASAAVGLPLLLAAAWAGLPWLTVVAAAAAAAAAVELGAMARGWGAAPATPLAVGWGVGLVVAAHFLAKGSPFEVTVAPALGGGALLSVGGALLRAPRARVVGAWGATALAALYPGGLLSYGILLREVDSGREWLLFALLVTFATDTGALLVGRSIGIRPMAPKVSPSKTWEGAAGGLVSAAGAAMALDYLLGLDVAWWEALALGAAAAVVAQLGDLMESRFKRAASVKDSGWLVPGHGGVLDRIDSLVLTLVVVYYALLWWLR